MVILINPFATSATSWTSRLKNRFRPAIPLPIRQLGNNALPGGSNWRSHLNAYLGNHRVRGFGRACDRRSRQYSRYQEVHPHQDDVTNPNEVTSCELKYSSPLA